MRIWELYESYGRDADGNPDHHFKAELSRQPLVCHCLGLIPNWFWNFCTDHLPKYVTDPGFDHGTWGWRLRWELWSSYDAPRWRRKTIEWVRVRDRDPDTWFLPNGDTPLPKDDHDQDSSRQP